MNKRADNGDSGTPVVLIVNSEQSVLEFLTAVLVSDGLHVTTCRSAREYRTLGTLKDVACAILDVALVDADGLTMQEIFNGRGLATVFVTRYGSVAACCRALKSGAIDFLSLPCAPQEIISAVYTAIESGRNLRTEKERLEDLRSRFALLTRREKEVFVLVASGLLNKQVAQHLEISEITVQIHRGRVMKKMAAASFAALVRMAQGLQLPVIESSYPYRPVSVEYARGPKAPRHSPSHECADSTVRRLKSFDSGFGAIMAPVAGTR